VGCGSNRPGEAANAILDLEGADAAGDPRWGKILQYRAASRGATSKKKLTRRQANFAMKNFQGGGPQPERGVGSIPSGYNLIPLDEQVSTWKAKKKQWLGTLMTWRTRREGRNLSRGNAIEEAALWKVWGQSVYKCCRDKNSKII